MLLQPGNDTQAHFPLKLFLALQWWATALKMKKMIPILKKGIPHFDIMFGNKENGGVEMSACSDSNHVFSLVLDGDSTSQIVSK